MAELFLLTFSCVWLHSTIFKGYYDLQANRITAKGTCGSQYKTLVLPCLFVCKLVCKNGHQICLICLLESFFKLQCDNFLVECYTSHSLIYLTCHVILHRSIAVLFCILMLLLLQRLCRNCNGFVVPHFPQFSVYEVYTDVPYNILMQGILLTPLIWCRSHL